MQIKIMERLVIAYMSVFSKRLELLCYHHHHDSCGMRFSYLVLWLQRKANGLKDTPQEKESHSDTGHEI